MWVPKEVADWFRISKDSVDALREELAAVRAERDHLRIQLATTQNNFDWVKTQINQLQVENKSLMAKAYGISVPVPELVRRTESNFNLQDLFTDERETKSDGWDQ